MGEPSRLERSWDADRREHRKDAPRLLILLFILILFVPAFGWVAADMPVVVRSSGPTSAEAMPLAEGATVVRFSPASLSLPVGLEVTVDLMIDDVQDLYAYQLSANFDPTVVTVLDGDALRPGVNITLGDFLNPASVPMNICDNVSGTVQVSVLQGVAESSSGSGRVLSIVMRGEAVGEMDLLFEELSLLDVHGRPITPTIQLPDYEVVPASSGPTWTPTATTFATETPTPTATETVQNTATHTPTPTPTLPGTGPTPYFYLGPQVSQVAIDGTQAVTVSTSYVGNLVGVQFGLRWDPAVFQVLDEYATAPGVQIAPGNLFSGMGTLPGANQVDNVRGELGYSIALVNPSSGVSGTWAVAHIRFRPLGLGSSDLEFYSTSMQEHPYYIIPSGAVDGELQVIAPSGTPTLTATPSASPSVTPTGGVATATSTPTPTIGAPTSTPTAGTPTHTATASVSPTPTATFPPITPEAWLYIPLVFKDA